MDIAEVETKDDLQKWIVQFFPDAKVELSSEGVIIKTGADVHSKRGMKIDGRCNYRSFA